VGHLAQFRRGVVGSFTLDSASLMPKNFKEIINTPHLAEEIVKERAGFLFKELVKKGKLRNIWSCVITWNGQIVRCNIRRKRIVGFFNDEKYPTTLYWCNKENAAGLPLGISCFSMLLLPL